MVLQSFTSFFIIIPSSSEEERERKKKITHGKMQMSLEAITMLMRFHHRSYCSGIRGIFHPYLENNCVLKIGDTLPSVHSRVSFHFQQDPQQAGIWSELDRRRLHLLSFTELPLKQQTTVVYLQSYHHVAL